jgi:hypothetical protein
VRKPLSARQIAMLDRVEHLPDSAAAPLEVCALLSGTSVGTWRRSPPVPTFFVSSGRLAANLGRVRQLTRGELARPPPK